MYFQGVASGPNLILLSDDTSIMFFFDAENIKDSLKINAFKSLLSFLWTSNSKCISRGGVFRNYALLHYIVNETCFRNTNTIFFLYLYYWQFKNILGRFLKKCANYETLQIFT